MSDLRRWALTAAGNDFPVPDGWPEDMARSQVNNAARELMRAVRKWYDNPEWIDLMVDTSGDPLTISFVSTSIVRVEARDMTSYFTAGRRIRMSTGGGAYTYGHVVSAAMTGPDTDVTVDTMSGAGSVVPAGVDQLDLHITSTLGTLAFQNALDLGFYVPVSNDDEGIQGAIDDANAAGGGIVLLTAAAYAVDGAITVKSDVVVFGSGPSSTVITVDAGLATTVISMSSRSAIVGVTINAAAQTATQDTIRVSTSSTEVIIQNVRLESPANHGIRVGISGNKLINISDVWIEDPDKSGIIVEDDLDDNDEITLSNITVRDPGNDGTTVDVYGIQLAGRCSATNVNVTCDRASPQKQRGVYLTTKDSAGLKGSKECTVSNLLVSGSGDQAIGIEIGGRGNAVSNVTMDLSGSSSRGIVIDSTGGGGQVADYNTISNFHVKDSDIGIQLASDADDNVIRGGTILSAGTKSVQIGGERNRLTDIYAFQGGSPSFEFLGGSADNECVGCVAYRNITGIGFEILASSEQNTLRGCIARSCADGMLLTGDNNRVIACEFRDCTDAVDSGADSINNRIMNCLFDNVTNQTADYSEGRNIWVGNQLADGLNYPLNSNAINASLEDNVVSNAVFASENVANVSIYGGLEIPGPAPDGGMWWKFQIAGIYQIPSVTRTITLKFYTSSAVDLLGTLVQTISLTIVGTSKAFEFSSDGADFNVDFTHANAVATPDAIYWQPASGHRYFLISCRLSSDAATDWLKNTTGLPMYGVSDAYVRAQFVGGEDMEGVTS